MQAFLVIIIIQVNGSKNHTKFLIKIMKILRKRLKKKKRKIYLRGFLKAIN